MFIFSFIGFLVLIISKELLVFNAETLVLITFFLFILCLVVQLKKSVLLFFEERSLLLFKGFFSIRESFLDKLNQFNLYLSTNFFLIDKIYLLLTFLKYACWASLSYSDFLFLVSVNSFILDLFNRLKIVESRVIGHLYLAYYSIILKRVFLFFTKQNKKDKNLILLSSINLLK